MTDIVERLEHYAKLAMPHYPNDLCSEAKREIESLRSKTSMADGMLALSGLNVDIHATDIAVMKSTMAKLIAAEKEIESLRNVAQSAWHPIETAPTDGTSVLIGESDRGSCGEAYFEKEEHRWYWANTAPHDYPEPHEPFPTHWMPMPQAPALSSAERGQS